MLHSDVLAQKIANSCKIGSKQFRPVNYADAIKLKIALREDACAIAHASMTSLFEGIQGVCKSRFTWSVVKLYYSAFYSCRALLMLRGISIFYLGRSPYLLEATPGSIASHKSGNSHTVALSEFRTRFSADELLSQSIDAGDPLEWIENLRNAASYKTAPFRDPEPIREFAKPCRRLRAHIQAYLGPDKTLYMFDPDHAMIAFPISLLLRLSNELALAEENRIPVDRHYVDILSGCECFLQEIPVQLSSFDFSGG